MAQPIIRVENLSKKFIIGHQKAEKYTALRDVIARNVKGGITKTAGLFRRKMAIDNEVKEEFWALRDVNFEIKQGDRVGIIGRNGAGKSTLLKILSRITEPTEGRITISGRVASLLEVGTGFHPELTGRENIFLNGAILGMSRVEIKKKFDEIVSFAEVEKFLDTPVKRYSSGMYVRLAFAVAAHLEPEILVVDEVLAVGDAQFQKKCLGKMDEVSKREGRTVLFVSHNMQAISNLCNDGIYLGNGKLQLHDRVDKAIERYMSAGETINSRKDLLEKIQNIPADPEFKLLDVKIYQKNRESPDVIVNGAELEIHVFYELYAKLTGFRIFLDLCDEMGNVIFRSFHDEDTDGIQTMEPSKYISKVTIPANFLAPISYELRLLFGIHNIRMLPPGDTITIKINVEQNSTYNNAYGGQYTAGKICPSIPWEIQKTH